MIAEVFQAERERYHQPARGDEPFSKRQVVYAAVGGLELAGTLYSPPSAGERRRDQASRPAVVFVHGGGWWEGDRGQFARHAAFMAAHGFVGLCISYRLSCQAPYPACIEDAKAAVRWLRRHADELAIDSNRLGIVGSSAGAHVAAMVATTGDGEPAPAGAGRASAVVQAGVFYNGIFKLPPDPADTLLPEALVVLLGGTFEQMPDRYREASPIEHVDSQTPPCLLLHGDADDIVSHRQSVRFAEKLRAAGGQAEVVIVPGVAHGQLNDRDHLEPCLRRMIGFFDGTLRYLPGSSEHR